MKILSESSSSFSPSMYQDVREQVHLERELRAILLYLTIKREKEKKKEKKKERNVFLRFSLFHKEIILFIPRSERLLSCKGTRLHR